MLSDSDKKVCTAYGVIREKNIYGKEVKGIARTSFLIGPDGRLAHVFENVKPEGHADGVLTVLRGLKRPVLIPR